MAFKYSSRNTDQIECWRFATIFLLLLVLTLGIALAIVTVILVQTMKQMPNANSTSISTSQESPCTSIPKQLLDLSEPSNPGPLSDLTEREFDALKSYLFSLEEFNITNTTEALISDASIQSIELLLPDKVSVLNFLNGSVVSTPERWAKVILYRGDLDTPVVQEYAVGPLSRPTSHRLLDYNQRRQNPVPFSVRPLGSVEQRALLNSVFDLTSRRLGGVLFESFGLSTCKADCLTITVTPVSDTAFSNMTRKLWIGFAYKTEYLTLHPLDLQVLIEHSGVNTSSFRTSSIWYNQRLFDSIDSFLDLYNNGSVDKIQMSFPSGKQESFSKMDLRGDILDEESRRPPRQFEPDGKRYTVKHQTVKYLGWEFNYRMSTATGPMLLNVNYREERIAYEISLQEVSVFYSSANPQRHFSNYVDSFALLGAKAKVLVPGADCPYHTSFLPARHFTDTSDSSVLNPFAWCIFEQNTGMPLRRHHSFTERYGSFYNGMIDDVLVLRTIITIGNYDYVIDYIFHQNGVLEVKVASTGYIVASVYTAAEEKYGFRIQDNILGNIHHHMFHFKVDIDVNGVENRFETLDIVVENPTGDLEHPQIAVNQTLKRSELESAYKYNFETPKYLLFHNQNVKDKYGNDRAYRLAIHGISKQMLPEGVGHEPAVSWSRYQLAVTKYNSNEQTSSSMYAQIAGLKPVVNFQSYIDNNEYLVDQDLVAWVTMGVHHIPHTEDLPVTTTPGGHLQFFLLPYNYFEEDPSMASQSATRIDLDTTSREVVINRYGLNPDIPFLPNYFSDWDISIQKDSSILFDNE